MKPVVVGIIKGCTPLVHTRQWSRGSGSAALGVVVSEIFPVQQDSGNEMK